MRDPIAPTNDPAGINGQPNIRAAEVGDIDSITAIYRHAVLHGFGTFEIDPPDASEIAARYGRVVAGGYPYLVATEGQRVLGFAYVFAYRDRPAYRFTVEDSVYVGADARGQGVGKALMSALIGQAVSAGFRQMIAVIGDADNIGSIRLHEAMGFRPAGQLTASGWKSDGGSTWS